MFACMREVCVACVMVSIMMMIKIAIKLTKLHKIIMYFVCAQFITYVLLYYACLCGGLLYVLFNWNTCERLGPANALLHSSFMYGIYVYSPSCGVPASLFVSSLYCVWIFLLFTCAKAAYHQQPQQPHPHSSFNSSWSLSYTLWYTCVSLVSSFLRKGKVIPRMLLEGVQISQFLY